MNFSKLNFKKQKIVISNIVKNYLRVFGVLSSLNCKFIVDSCTSKDAINSYILLAMLVMNPTKNVIQLNSMNEKKSDHYMSM